jgi:hypothetical protein
VTSPSPSYSLSFRPQLSRTRASARKRVCTDDLLCLTHSCWPCRFRFWSSLFQPATATVEPQYTRRGRIPDTTHANYANLTHSFCVFPTLPPITTLSPWVSLGDPLLECLTHRTTTNLYRPYGLDLTWTGMAVDAWRFARGSTPRPGVMTTNHYHP